MWRLRVLTLPLALILIFAATPMYAPTFEVTRDYYNDYFVTAVGGEIMDCGSYWYDWSWGTTDGNYRTVETRSCSGSFHYTACNQKVNGEWVEIECPF